MPGTIFERATNPHQYDLPEVNWLEEGSGDSPKRRFMLEYLRPAIGALANKSVLDVGCGTGWLLADCHNQGAMRTIGIDPSLRNYEAAHLKHSDLTLIKTSLEEFESPEQFDVISVVMALEHIADIKRAFQKLIRLSKPSAKLITITADPFAHTRNRFDYQIEREPQEDGSVALEVIRPARYGGTLCDVIRPLELYVDAATAAGFYHERTIPMIPTENLLRDEPRFRETPSTPIFQLLVFKAPGLQGH